MIYYNLSNWVIYYHIRRYFFLLFYYSILHSFNILTSSRSNSDSTSFSLKDMRILPKNLSSSLCRERWFLYIMMSEMISELNWFHMIIITRLDKLKTCFTSILIIRIINISQIIRFNWGYKYLFIHYQSRIEIL